MHHRNFEIHHLESKSEGRYGMFRGISQSQGHQFDKSRFQEPRNFRLGETFKGMVMRRLSGGGVLVAAQGRQFRAHTALNLQEGSQHHFQVKSLGSKVELKVMDGEIKRTHYFAGGLTNVRAARKKLVEILAELTSERNLNVLPFEAKGARGALTRLLPAIVYSGPEKDAGQSIMRCIFGSGIFWESKVARCLLGDKKETWHRLMAEDLKGLLLSLKKTLAGQEGGDAGLSPLAQKIEEALLIIEQEQFLNLSAIRDEAGWFMFLPGLHDDGFLDAEVFVEKNSDRGAIRFFMVMGFTHLGRMEVTVTIDHHIVDVKMLMEDEKKVSLVTEQLAHLEEALEKGGLRAGRMVCDVCLMEAPNRGSSPEDQWFSKPIHLII